MDGRWIHVRNWDRFQHPDTTRAKTERVGGLPWIRDHTGQLNDEEWLELSFADRGLLQSIRLQYGATRGRGLVDSTASLTRLLGQRVLRSQLERLNHAGFIEFRASKLRAPDLQPARLDTEEIQSSPLPPQSGGIRASTNNDKPTNPRAVGTNPRAVAKTDKERAHQELLTYATKLADTWDGTDSEEFDVKLDYLEIQHDARLTHLERDNLWEKAFSLGF